MRKLTAIWLILTHKAYFVAVCKTGMNGDDMTTIGNYTYAMAETLINKHIADVDTYLDQEDAIDEANDIINGIL
jgi:hypothetical protein